MDNILLCLQTQPTLLPAAASHAPLGLHWHSTWPSPRSCCPTAKSFLYSTNDTKLLLSYTFLGLLLVGIGNSSKLAIPSFRAADG